ncbi:hypothetical protein NMG60_11022572 [Bertholletia excelsa]
MGRERSDQAVICSSIALLQERFRQLQKVKEMRQGRELLLRNLSSSEPEFNYSPIGLTPLYEPSMLFFQSEILLPQPRPPSQASLSLWPDYQIRHGGAGSRRLWPTSKPSAPIKIVDSDHSDVDTSLHL